MYSFAILRTYFAKLCKKTQTNQLQCTQSAAKKEEVNMNILAIDDEPLALRSLCNSISEAQTDAQIKSFDNAKDALECCKDTNFDVACLDIEIGEMNGVELAKRLKVMQPSMNIIFTTGYSEYMEEAFRLHASGYLLKPISAEKVKRELKHLRNPVADQKQLTGLFVKTFGEFDVFVNGEPLIFKYDKAKELFAYLIDRRGSLCETKKILSILFEGAEQDNYNYFKGVKKNMLDTIKACGFKEIINNKRTKLGVFADKIDCDFYKWIDGDPTIINSYFGEYMAQYSWAEVTNAALSNHFWKNNTL